MCQLCNAKAAPWVGRRAFLVAAGAVVAGPAISQVDVGESSRLRSLVPADELEQAATQQYGELLQEARAKRALAPESHPQLQRLRSISSRLIADAPRWNPRARGWRWEVNLIGSDSINAFCMPGGKIAVFTGLIDKLRLSDDELAMVVGHEIAHALREHARERIAKSKGTGALLSFGAQLFGLGQLGDVAANIGTELLTLKFSRDDEIEADLVGLEMGARAGFNPQASISLWEKMAQASGGSGGSFLSTHPSGPDRMRRLAENIPRVEGLYRQAAASRPATMGNR
ncbi:M48 family metallopeptidase [Ramlibacter monticola]|uniref:M48 family metallopeptidase n=1 Tax=Ramlibacter monticola TaxID=1926872 RepID=A0A937CT83_9BURK|nr:M48 family metallopeptidase [Ramlibacter monticola]MBL0392265.1 M48 family metallopeptidase [Ramlibacter monticola]